MRSQDVAWNFDFDTVSARRGHERNLMSPYFAAYCRDGIAEGQDRFWIPCGGSRFEFSRFGDVVRPESDDGEQAEQGRRGAKDRLVGPLTLGLDAERGADFRDGDLDLPATDEPGEDVTGTRVDIGTGGTPPRDRMAAPLAISTRRSVRPYQRLTR